MSTIVNGNTLGVFAFVLHLCVQGFACRMQGAVGLLAKRVAGAEATL